MVDWSGLLWLGDGLVVVCEVVWGAMVWCVVWYGVVWYGWGQRGLTWANAGQHGQHGLTRATVRANTGQRGLTRANAG